MQSSCLLQLLLIVFLSILGLLPVSSGNSFSESESWKNCPSECICSETTPKFPTVTCSSSNLTSILPGIPPTTKKLDLSGNNLTGIGPNSLAHLVELRELNLKSNLIKEVDANAFVNLSHLQELILSWNQLNRFPSKVIQPHSPIELLNLEHNNITQLQNNSVSGATSTKLFTLLLGHNRMEHIEDGAFQNMPNLHILELNDNRLTEVPAALQRLHNLQELTLANNRIKRLSVPLAEILPKIVLLEVRGNPLQWVHPGVFTHLQHLKKLILSDVKNLTEMPDLDGMTSLEILRIDRCSLHSVPTDLCSHSPQLKSLDLKSNRIRKLPRFTAGCSNLKNLDLSSNMIEDLDDGAFIPLSNLHHLHLSSNGVKKLRGETFSGLSQLKALDLSYNNIDDIHPGAFLRVEKLEDLNLGNNIFSALPSVGLSGVIHLKTFNNPNLREFPGVESFPRVRTLVLSYAYHCCQFSSHSLSSHRKGASGSEDQSSILLEEDVIYPTDTGFDSALSTLNLSALWPGIENFTNHGTLSEDFIKTFASESLRTTEIPFDFVEPNTEIYSPQMGHIHRSDVQCIPQPGPFLPCTDLFDWWTLRCGVWIVFLLALMGNGTVVFVLIFARTKMDVPRFLVCNLAIADFFMGVYLGFLAVVDSATLGEFRRYAIPWQLSTGCRIAGFLGVLSSELSVYTLAVITMERHYAITHAMHLNKRLSLRHAAYIMALGWTFSLVMAVLPLFGISDYRKFAVCLPFEIGDGLSLSYVVFLMFANGVAFTILMGCYLKMYCSIRGSQAWNSNDTRIAKRMALLVFTDLLCWFPIAFFSLTAIFGLQLVSLEEAKVFTVFILPFNSCCNPFLYAILTKQFKKDCVLICKAIEESRVTRGIGRCRNSSNFSNRQTAPNTGSLMEKSSKDGQPCICHSGLHPGRGDVNGNAKYRFIPAPERWSRYGRLGCFISRYILRQNNSKEANRQARDDYRMRNVRRYLYNTANTANFQQDVEKHQRHASVSSDNFSSSRSDSWRAQGRCGIPLRLLEPRRRNSWAVTRKPSQDSNLSNSRNDSSGTSNSTATWQMSRSSVSSDAASHSGGGKSSLKKSIPGTTASVPHLNSHINTNPTPIAINSIQTSANINSVPPGTKRPKTLQFVEDSVSVPPQRRNSQPQTEAIQVLPHSAKPTGLTKNTKYNSKAKRDPDIVTTIIDDDEVSAKIATNRPRLVRQSAFFSDEVIIEPEVCPVHGSLIPGTYDDDEMYDDNGEHVSDLDEIGEEEDEEEDVDLNGDPSSPILRKQSGPSPVIAVANNSCSSNGNNNPYSIALVIIPRRLSTISSKDTVSLQSKDESGADVNISSNLNTTNSTGSSQPGSSSSPNRRKLSEQPVHFYVLPPGAAPRWRSMSSVEIQHHEHVGLTHSNSTRNSIPENVPEEEMGESKKVSFQLPKSDPVDTASLSS